MSKLCGVRKTASTNAYTKNELVDLAFSKGLVKTKTDAKKRTVHELCVLLELTTKISKKSKRLVKSSSKKLKTSSNKVFNTRKRSKKQSRSNRTKQSRSKKSKESRSNRTKQSKKQSRIVKKVKPCSERSNIPLKKHQLKVINFINDDTHKSLLVVHSTGSGKTLTAVTASQCYLDKYPNHKIIVITPASLQENFKKEMNAYGIEHFEPYQFFTIQGFYFASKRGDIDCSHSFFILDEAHNLRTDIDENRHLGMYSSALLKCAREASKVMLLTATPFINDVNDISNLMAMINQNEPEHIKRITNLEDYFKCKVSIYTPPESELEQHYPKTTDHEVFLTMTPSYLKKYKKIEDSKTEDEDIEDFKGKMYYTGLRRASNALEKEKSPKVDWIINMIRDKHDEKFLVFSHWLESGINLLMNRLQKEGISYGHIIGELSGIERNNVVEAYNRGDIRVLLISKAGSEGLDLKLTNNVIIMEPSWNESTHKQVIGRAVRYTSHISLPKEKRQVNIYRLYMIKPNENTIKKYIIENNLLENDYDDNDSLLSVDFYLRNMSIEKQKKIRKMMSILKKASIERNECGEYELKEKKASKRLKKIKPSF